MDNILRLRPKFFIFSLSFHVVIVFLFLWLDSNKALPYRFRVFGAHSSKPSFVYFKSLQSKTSMSSSSSSLNKIGNSKVVEIKTEQNEKQDAVIDNKNNQTSNVKNSQAKKNAKSNADINPKKKVKNLASKKVVVPKNSAKKNKKPNIVPKQLEKSPQKPKIEPVLKSEVKNIKTNDDKINNENIFKISNFNKEGLSILEDKVSKAFSKVWTPPVNVPKGTECTIKFNVSKLGKIDKFVVEKSSKILIYDMSILGVLDKVVLPVEVWGRLIQFEFVQ